MYISVKIDHENNRFYTAYNGFRGELRFRKINPKLYELNFLQGQNSQEVEDELIYTACLFAQKEGIKIIPGCEKVNNYLNRHSEFFCVAYNERSLA